MRAALAAAIFSTSILYSSGTALSVRSDDSGPVCGQKGWAGDTPAYWTFDSSPTFANCHQTCDYFNCTSFAHYGTNDTVNNNQGACLLFNVSATGNIVTDDSSLWQFYDIACATEQQCGISGNNNISPAKEYNGPNLQECTVTCQNDPNCFTYSYNSDDGTCGIYYYLAQDVISPNPDSPVTFYSTGCEFNYDYTPICGVSGRYQDVYSSYMEAESAADCQSQCMSNLPWTLSFTWDHSIQDCECYKFHITDVGTADTWPNRVFYDIECDLSSTSTATTATATSVNDPTATNTDTATATDSGDENTAADTNPTATTTDDSTTATTTDDSAAATITDDGSDSDDSGTDDNTTTIDDSSTATATLTDDSATATATDGSSTTTDDGDDSNDNDDNNDSSPGSIKRKKHPKHTHIHKRNIPIASAGSISPRANSSLVCGQTGYNGATDSFWAGTYAPTIEYCLTACQVQTGCLSFAWYGTNGTMNGECQLYKVPVTGNFNAGSNSPYAFYDLGCMQRQHQECAVAGYDKTSSISESASTDVGSCAASCLDQNQYGTCFSFAYGNGTCELYQQLVVDNVTPDTTSPYTFYDLGCSVPTSTASATVTVTMTRTTVTNTCCATQQAALGGYSRV